MFSVEDLLISHGYKLSKNPTNLSENRSDGFQHEDIDRRSGQTTLNGFPTHPGTYPNSKKSIARGYQNVNENNHVIQGRQLNANHKDFSGLANVHALQGGLYDQSQLSWSSHSKTDKDLAYWRRQGQDFSLLGYPDRADSETKGMAAPCALFGHDKESQWEIGGGLENMRTNTQETWKPPGDYRWQSLKTESWNQPTAFGELVPDTDKERLLQDMYSVRRDVATSHVKSKSQSFPRVLSPESFNCAEMPSLISSKHHKAPGLALETLKHSEPATHFLPLPRPKYGRPLKPPSYEFHQQTRGTLETSSLQDDQQKDKAGCYLTKVNEPVQDSSLEPPLYIPPPCYKSPGQQSMNQHVPKEVPEYDMCFNNDMQVPEQRIFISSQPSINQFQTGDEHYKNEQILYNSKRHLRHGENCLSSVQYIPFDDPRIRHIKITHPADLQKDDNVGDANRINSNVFHKSSVEQEFNNSFLDLPDSINTAIKCNQVSGSSVYSSRWLVESSVDQDSCALSTQRDSYDVGNDLNCEYPKGRPSAPSPHMELSCETLTKVKTFEPGTEIQGKKSSKKKTHETIFCLVSIPVQSELNMPDTDRNNNVTQGASEKNGLDTSGVLQEQSFLSTSSTDLELQALTGNMTNKNELQKQELWRPEFKQMNDLRFRQPAKHRELQYSGSWPGDQYKDQQTQTSFMEEPKIQQLLHGSQPRKSNTLTTGHLLRYGSSTIEPTLSILPADDRKGRQVTSPVKGQGHLDKPSKTECSRTSVLNPKAGQNATCASGTALPGREREPSFAHKEERNSPCSSKELFGQFLLKPVSRRPWDVISELESFNKELQEQEENNEDGTETENKQEREEEEKERRTERGTCRDNEKSQDHRSNAQSLNVTPATSVFKQGTDKSKFESVSVSKSSDARVVFSDHVYVRSQVKEMDKAVKAENGYVAPKQKKQEGGRRVIKRAVSLHPIKPNVSGPLDNEKRSNPFNSINFREASAENYKDNVVGFDKLKRAAGRNILAVETESVVQLSLTNRNQGHSEPDLRSVGLDDGEGSGTGALDSCTEIPPNESLQARAARILGIEVAVESLIADNETLPDEHSRSENMPQSVELSNEKMLGGGMETNMTSYEGKQKCGLSKRSFVGENISLGSIKDQCSGEEMLTAEQYFQHHHDISRHQEDHAHPLESVVLPFAERKSLPLNVEKRPRSTSKVIETLQGKLASPSSRAAMDRLVRMKEVDSVSRMRRLSIKNAESGEDGDEDKQLKGPEERGNDASFGRNEFPRKLSHGSSVSKRIISLAENGLLDNRNMKKTGRDLFCLDAYDPSRVERV
ncbi:junctional protein associated with coronary artery disease isoform X1 [Python bivittatus]|uniref:Junctional protein associated with coronary artery disease isoform X1 n=1 Tax=Python bivittatus TaxID=176946 RepID=A0A9F5IUJ3_PYTBI|nr:junctional protein associated with coronary artery disease isoform X1 [Python bivittatus]XP_025028245.1 junctional protein associated with coronary artery disease isoform X1 [Python bivittatus]XP_025028246.1 junctional protein associated with coronary artery disease isoform X1 [Python bivittatus]